MLSFESDRQKTSQSRQDAAAFQAMKLRKVALKAGAPREYGKAGPGRDYWIKEIRHREMEYVKRAEDAYARMVEAWRQVPPKGRKKTC